MVSKRSYPFGDGMHVAWDLVAWHGDREQVDIAALSREDIVQLRGHFDRGDDVWMYNSYSVPDAALPTIAELVPSAQLDPQVEYFIESRQDLPDGECWTPGPGKLSPGHVPPP